MTADDAGQHIIDEEGRVDPLAAPAKQRLFGEQLHLDVLTTNLPAGGSLEAFDPFVTLEGRGRFARTLLAGVIGPTGQTVCEVALRIQRDDYGIDELEGWTNRDIEVQWQRQFRTWSIAAAAGAAPAILDILPRPADGGPPRRPPTLYCKERRALFVAPCPTCGAALETCRDEALLNAYGLPGFDASLQRFLYCAPCHAAERAATFYAVMVTDPALRARAPVGDQLDLYRAFRDLARNGGPLPCSGCSSVPTCYPEHDPGSGAVVGKLVALSFYDFGCISLTPTRGFYYDELAALLGGRSFEDAVPDKVDPTSPYRVGDPATRYHGAQRYLFEDDPQGKLPLEILRLKLALFSQLVTAISRLQRATHLPHLGLSPDKVMVELVDGVPGVPLFWNFRAQLVEVGSATLCRLKGLEPEQLEIPLLDPPPLRDPTYAPPRTSRRQRPGEKLKGMLSIIRLAERSDARWVLEASLTSEELDLGAVGPKDLCRLEIYQTRPVPIALTVFAYATDAGEQQLRLQGVPTRIERGVVELLRPMAGQAPTEVTFTTHPCMHIPDDIQSLGLMLFTTLSANSEQSPGTVTKAARRVSEAVARFAADTAGATADDIEEYAITALVEAEKDGALARRQILDRPSAWVGDVTIPDRFWYSALVLGLRALTQTPEFGFCRGHDDFDPQHPEGAADHLRAELDILAHKLDEDLLGMGGKRAMFTDAIAQVQRELFAPADRPTLVRRQR